MRLIITEQADFSKWAYKALSDNFDVINLQHISELNEQIQTAQILFIRLGVNFTKEVLKKAKRLKIICTPTTGLDHIDLEYCEANNIKVISLKDQRLFLDSIPSTAEHAWTLLMAINRKIWLANTSVNSKQWDRDSFKSFNLKGKKLGILGLGRVGKQMVDYAKAFGMTIIGYDLNPNIKIENVQHLRSAEELFEQSDFLSIHIPLDKSNIEFIDQKLIYLMKPNACLINTSRGQVWDEQAVVNALLKKKIRGVASDVIYDELSECWQNSPLLGINNQTFNCIITPHIAGATFDSMQMTEEFITKKLLSYVN